MADDNTEYVILRRPICRSSPRAHRSTTPASGSGRATRPALRATTTGDRKTGFAGTRTAASVRTASSRSRS